MASFAPLTAPLMSGGRSKKRISYFYDMDIGNFAYESGHPMKPHRIRLAHSLVINYGLARKMEIYRAKPATPEEMTNFHTDDYIGFLQLVTPENMNKYPHEQAKYNIGADSPIFDGLFEFCGISAGGSIEGAARLSRAKCDVAVNWAGGLHHAKKGEGSGFCYVNDIVLAILELLRFHARVLYIDIDVHHGDGVEEAFYTTDRVMTVSFHRFGEFFPGTGELRDIGVGQGKHYSVNFPLRDGIDDVSYKAIFEAVIDKVIERYRPGAVVLQCGADSLSGDRLGSFNLSMRGHANCVEFVKSFNLPTLVLGGGGYTMKNVARTWAYETGVLLEQPMDTALPYNEYYQYYAPDFELDVKPSNAPNANGREYLNKITTNILENLNKVDFAPSAQMMDIPPDPVGMDSEAEDELDDEDEDENKDVRYTQHRRDKMIADEDGYVSDSDEEDERPQISARRNIADYRRSPSTLAETEAPAEDAEDAGEDAEEEFDEDVEDDTTGLEIEVEVPAENGADLAEPGSEDEIPRGEARDGAEEEASPLNPTLDSSAELTPEATSDTSELQGDTVMVDAPPIAE